MIGLIIVLLAVTGIVYAAAMKKLALGILVGIPVIILGVAVESYVSIPAGHRGVLLQFGAVKGVLSEGAHFITPFMQKVSITEVRTQKEVAKASAASKDLQTVSSEVAINFHIDPGQVGELFKNVGSEYAERIIDPATQETVKSVVANYTAEELIKSRARVKTEIDTLLTGRLRRYSIVVEPGGVSLTNFEFSEEFNRAIEQKQVAQQSAEQQKYELQKAELQAQTLVATAEGRAKAAKIEAEALNSQGGQKVLAKMFIDKWNGQFPTVMGSNQMMFDMREFLKDIPSSPR